MLHDIYIKKIINQGGGGGGGGKREVCVREKRMMRGKREGKRGVELGHTIITGNISWRPRVLWAAAAEKSELMTSDVMSG